MSYLQWKILLIRTLLRDHEPNAFFWYAVFMIELSDPKTPSKGVMEV